jgi:hypothetical protein
VLLASCLCIPRYNQLMAPEDAPATKRDIRDLEERLLERMRDMQTELLKAFLRYQECSATRRRLDRSLDN